MQLGYGIFVSVLLFAGTRALAAEADFRALVNDFWFAETATETGRAGALLRERAPDIDTLYRWLRSGPEFRADVPRGYRELERIAADGTVFPYVLLVPESYDPGREYPVDFMLHGGISRPTVEPNGGWWTRGYDSLENPDRITVVPAAWSDAFWWFPNQAENLREILKSIKREYNIDENRVYMTGFSDGGTGAYFFAFKQPTEWAAFLPFIAHPGVLRNPGSGPGYQLYFENLMAKPLYIVNGEEDPLYPVSSLLPFIEVLRGALIEHVFKPIAGGGHNTAWLPAETPMIEQFKREHPRDPFPVRVQWVTDSTERFNRNHWVVVNKLARENQPGAVDVTLENNVVSLRMTYVDEVTVLLNPEEVDFESPVAVYVNGGLRSISRLEQDPAVLLKWAGEDRDRSMLVTAELVVRARED